MHRQSCRMPIATYGNTSGVQLSDNGWRNTPLRIMHQQPHIDAALGGNAQSLGKKPFFQMGNAAPYSASIAQRPFGNGRKQPGEAPRGPLPTGDRAKIADSAPWPKQIADMIPQPGRKVWIRKLHQQVMPSILVSDFGDDFLIFRFIARGIERTDEHRRPGMRKVIYLAVKMGMRRLETRTMDRQSARKPMGAKHGQNLIVRVRTPWLSFQNKPHPDASITGLHQSMCKVAIPEVIGRPNYFTAGRYGFDAVAQQVPQRSGRQVGSAEMNDRVRQWLR